MKKWMKFYNYTNLFKKFSISSPHGIRKVLCCKIKITKNNFKKVPFSRVSNIVKKIREKGTLRLKK